MNDNQRERANVAYSYMNESMISYYLATEDYRNEIKNIVKELHEEGYTKTEIAKELNMSRTNLYELIRPENTTRRRYKKKKKTI